MSLFDALKQELQLYLPDPSIATIYNAFLLAEKAHQSQQRISGEQYITHPVEVALTLAKMRLDAQSIMAALLHDVLEDTKISREKIEKQFGTEVLELVEGVTKLTQIHFESHVEAQAENFRKMMIAMVRDIRVILIKLADRLHNVRTLHHLPPEKQKRIAKETLEIYAPIANRLGMHTFRIEFEEHGFENLFPLRYRAIHGAMKKALGSRIEILKVIESSLKNTLVKSQLTHYALFGREKHAYSIYRKMKKKQLKFSEIMDVYGFRIVVDSVDDCYRALGQVHNLYKPFPRRFKDYIAIPKANGYQSLHTVLFGPYGVPIEIQIRTREMDQMAENGIAAHWIYKTDEEMPSQTQLRARGWLKGLMEMQQNAGSSAEFIENVKIDLFPDEVYVFTPKGDILELTSGSTAIDFAYAIHSDLGNSCVAVKIDRRLAPLSTRLRTGQTVEIITAPEARPHHSWLDFVATGKARSQIRNYLKHQTHDESVELGRRLLEKTLGDFHTSSKAITPAMFKSLLKTLKLTTLDDLYEQIGLGNQLPQIIVRKLLGTTETDKLPTESSTAETPLLIKGTEGMAVTFSKCCHPIPGDLVEGVLAAGIGLIVHRSNCPKLVELRRQPDKCVLVQWEDNIQGEFEVELRVELIDGRGVYAKLALAIAQAEGYIDNINLLERNENYSLISVLLTVHSSRHLAQVMQNIREFRNVLNVTRYLEG